MGGPGRTGRNPPAIPSTPRISAMIDSESIPIYNGVSGFQEILHGKYTNCSGVFLQKLSFLFCQVNQKN